MNFTKRFIPKMLAASAMMVAFAPHAYAAIGVGANASTTVNAAQARQVGEIQSTLDAIAAKFSRVVPVTAALLPYFDVGFKHDGQSRDEFIDKVLRNVESGDFGGFSYQGVRFSGLRAEKVIDADTLEVSYDVVFRKGFRPDRERLVAKRVGGNWLLVGNGLAARVHVSLNTRLVETPMSKDQILALPGVKTMSGSWEGQTYTYYQRTIADASGNALDLWLCREGQDCFGRMGWIGDEIGADARLTRFNYTQYYAKPSSRVSNGIVFEVPVNRVDASVTEIVVHGPGLPAAGLRMEPPIRRVRPYWVFKGDIFDWNVFNNKRCSQVNNPANPIADCGFDWSMVDKGAKYEFTLKDVAGNVVATLSDRLRSKPVDSLYAFKHRNDLFPQFKLDKANSFSIKNVYDDVSGPFMPGKTIAMNWAFPRKPGLQLLSVSLAVQTASLDTSLARIHNDYWSTKPLYGIDTKKAPVASVVFSPSHPINPNWAWATLTAIDDNGNVWEHEVSPNNPR